MKTATAAVLAATLTLTSCASPVGGVPSSPLSDHARIGGVVIAAVDSGTRPDAPAPVVQVRGTDGGAIDRLGAMAVEDVQAFWSHTTLPGGSEYRPLESVTSWDARTGGGVTVCGIDVTVNAAFCPPENSIGWDRGGLMDVLVQNTGEMAAALILAHEIGHYVDAQARRDKPPTIVREQRADCYAGSYFAWVAAGESPRFTVSSDGLDLVLEVLPIVADAPEGGDHGSSVARLSAFTEGFMRGPDVCAAIDITDSRDALPLIPGDSTTIFTPELVESVAAAVADVTGVPVDTSQVDIAAVNAVGAEPVPGVRGDGSGLTVLIAQLVQPWVAEQQVSSPRVSTCAVGSVLRGMAHGGAFSLTVSDLDEAVLAALTAPDGEFVGLSGSGFERTRGFVAGLHGGLESCG